jgi:tRNA threonylcarbamoyladenosine biosynthesis protein TsaE
VSETFVTSSESETIALGQRIAEDLKPGDIVALHGELGAGKTRLVVGIALALGIDRTLVNSPTYVLVNEYPTGSAGAERGVEALIHIDAYRLERPTDLEALGLDDSLLATSITVIEWPGRLASGLPAVSLDVRIGISGEETRAIQVTRP